MYFIIHALLETDIGLILVGLLIFIGLVVEFLDNNNHRPQI